MKYILILSCLFLISCKNGPALTICVSTPSINGFSCYNQSTGESSVLLYADSNKYVAMSPTDTQALLTFCGLPSNEAEQLKQINVAKMVKKIQSAVE